MYPWGSHSMTWNHLWNGYIKIYHLTRFLQKYKTMNVRALYKPHKPSLTTNLHSSFRRTWVFAFIRVISPYPEYSPLSCLLMDVSPFFLPPAQVSPSSWTLCNQFSPWWSGLCLPHPAVYSYNCTRLQVQAVGGLGGGAGSGRLTVSRMVHQMLVFFPTLPATICFSEFSNSVPWILSQFYICTSLGETGCCVLIPSYLECEHSTLT